MKDFPNLRTHTEGGFTIVESAIAAMIIAIAIGSIFYTQQRVEQLRSRNWSEVTDSAYWSDPTDNPSYYLTSIMNDATQSGAALSNATEIVRLTENGFLQGATAAYFEVTRTPAGPSITAQNNPTSLLTARMLKVDATLNWRTLGEERALAPLLRLSPAAALPSMKRPRLLPLLTGNPSRSRFLAEGGFTLTELMVASGVSALILMALVLGSIALQRSFAATDQYGTAQDSQLRVMDYLTRDLRRAGFGGLPAGWTASSAIDLSSSTQVSMLVPDYYNVYDSNGNPSTRSDVNSQPQDPPSSTKAI